MATSIPSNRHFPVPPTYAEPTIVDPSGKSQFNPIWLKWFLDVAQFLSGVGLTLTRQIDHDLLGNLQGGGGAGNYYHLSQAQLLAFFSNPMTAQGDIIVGDVGGAPTKLGVGAVGTKLTVGASGILSWA